MENASKALIMAATVLLAVVIITLGISLFSILGDFSRQKEEEMAKTKTAQFNSQFISYESNDNTAHHVISLINLVKNIDTDTYGTIKVRVEGTSISETSLIEELNNFLKSGYDSQGNPIKYYTGKIKYNTINPDKIDSITFK